MADKKPASLKSRIKKIVGDVLWYTEEKNDQHRVESIHFEMEDCSVTLDQLNRLSTLVGTKNITINWFSGNERTMQDPSLEILIKLDKKK